MGRGDGEERQYWQTTEELNDAGVKSQHPLPHLVPINMPPRAMPWSTGWVGNGWTMTEKGHGTHEKRFNRHRLRSRSAQRSLHDAPFMQRATLQTTSLTVLNSVNIAQWQVRPHAHLTHRPAQRLHVWSYPLSLAVPMSYFLSSFQRAAPRQHSPSARLASCSGALARSDTVRRSQWVCPLLLSLPLPHCPIYAVHTLLIQVGKA